MLLNTFEACNRNWEKLASQWWSLTTSTVTNQPQSIQVCLIRCWRRNPTAVHTICSRRLMLWRMEMLLYQYEWNLCWPCHQTFAGGRKEGSILLNVVTLPSSWKGWSNGWCVIVSDSFWHLTTLVVEDQAEIRCHIILCLILITVDYKSWMHVKGIISSNMGILEPLNFLVSDITYFTFDSDKWTMNLWNMQQQWSVCIKDVRTTTFIFFWWFKIMLSLV